MKRPLAVKRLLYQIVRTSLIHIIIVVVFSGMAVALPGKGQGILDKRVTISISGEPLDRVLFQLEKSVQIKFSYNSRTLQLSRPVSINASDESLSVVLDRLLKPLSISYLLIGNRIVLRKETVSQNNPPAESPVNNAGENNMADITVKGQVVDAGSNEVLPGVSIVVKGTQKGTVTDTDGNFSMQVPGRGVVLVFSFVGYEKQEVTVQSNTILKIVLQHTDKSLDEVIVVGYGTQKKINATGAISSMGTKELVQSPVANISNSLVGRLPGLFASQAGGEPGNDQSKLRIRGVGTFSGSTDPLILVDGVQVENYNNIDPNEIENITILKDASSTAVYGIRGANGVLIITTKRGKTGPPRISYSFNVGQNSFTTLRKGMNSYDYASATSSK